MSTSRLEDFPPVRKRRFRALKNVPVLPSLVTLGNLFFGFLAIAKVADALRNTAPEAPFAQLSDLFAVAATLIFVAMVFDALDGRIARMTGQATPFGAQLDSMADMVTFGVTPAFLGKVLVDLHAQGKDGLLPAQPKVWYVAAAIYVLCAAMRLARFNVETSTDEEDHREFKGLPSPAAAAVVAALGLFFCTQYDRTAFVSKLLQKEHFDWIVMAMPGVLAMLGLLMVSRVPYPHAIHALVKGRHSFPYLAGLVILIGLAAVEWQVALAAVAVGYVLWGLLLALYRLVTTGRIDRRGDDDDDAEQAPSLN